jgi:hypothetical protein
MSEQKITAYLGGAEWRLVQALRALPAGICRDRLWELLGELTDFVGQPACAEFQADGVPCPSARSDCSQCARVATVLARLRAELDERSAR